ncbi:MAG TPA: cysteine desulfurase family protein, partial [Chthoniobacteraceae bacterium]|nr:cysteine desulfurase family protein [Chthoniobacteraceae bacterium]
WLEAHAQYRANPSSPHRLGARAETAIANARSRVAAALGCDSQDVVWMSGATEANNTIVRHFAVTSLGAHAWVSAIEHPSVLAPVRHYFPRTHRVIPVNAAGVVELQWLEKAFKESTPAFVAVMAANNETGVLQPWKEIAALCRRFGVPYFCDAVQWIGKIDARELHTSDFVSGSAHKFGGPQGIGFLKCAASLDPLLRGGPQEEGRRAGTENVAGILAAAAALDERSSAIAADGGLLQKKTDARDRFINELLRLLPDVRVIGIDAARLWNTVAVIMPRLRGDARWVVKLDKQGVAVSTGSACASGREEPSHVARALEIPSDQAGRILRFSGGWETTEAEWRELLDAIERIVRGVGISE